MKKKLILWFLFLLTISLLSGSVYILYFLELPDVPPRDFTAELEKLPVAHIKYEDVILPNGMRVVDFEYDLNDLRKNEEEIYND